MKRKDDLDVPLDDLDLIPPRPATSRLEDLIDLRFQDVLSRASDPKELVAALKVATDWVKVRHGLDADKGWGSALGRTVRDE